MGQKFPVCVQCGVVERMAVYTVITAPLAASPVDSRKRFPVAVGVEKCPAALASLPSTAPKFSVLTTDVERTVQLRGVLGSAASRGVNCCCSYTGITQLHQ